jgi:hypothetical protein
MTVLEDSSSSSSNSTGAVGIGSRAGVAAASAVQSSVSDGRGGLGANVPQATEHVTVASDATHDAEAVAAAGGQAGCRVHGDFR